MVRATAPRIDRPARSARHRTPFARRSFRAARVATALAVLAAVAGCRYARPQPGVQLSSTPPGARISVGGAFSGFVTPARIDLATDDWHVVAVQLEGYEPQTRLVGPGTRLVAVDWREASAGSGDSFRFPLLMPIESILPFAVEARSEPQRLHFHLRRTQGE